MALVESAQPASATTTGSRPLSAQVTSSSRQAAPVTARYVILKRLARKDGGARYLALVHIGPGLDLRVSRHGRRIHDRRRAGNPPSSAPQRPAIRPGPPPQLRRVPPRESSKEIRKHTIIDHPVAACPDAARHLAAARRASRIRRRLEQHRSALRQLGPWARRGVQRHPPVTGGHGLSAKGGH